MVVRSAYDAFVLPRAALFQLAAVALVALWCGRRLWFPTGSADVHPLLLPGVLLVAWAAVSCAASRVPSVGLWGEWFRYEGLVGMGGYVALAVLAAGFLPRLRDLRHLSDCLAVAVAVVSAYGIAQYFGFDPLWPAAPGGRVFSTLGNPDYAGAFLAFALPVTLAPALVARETSRRVGYAAVTALAVVALVLTFTRGAWLAGLVAFLSMAWLAWAGRPLVSGRHWRRAAWTLLAAAGLAAIVLAASPRGAVSGGTYGAGRTAGPAGADTIASRLLLWRASLPVVRSAGWAGVGPDEFGLVWPAYKPAAWQRGGEQRIAGWFAHNEVLQTAATLGPVGLGLYLWLTLAGLAAGLAAVRSSETAPERLVLGAMWSGCLGYLVYLQGSGSLPVTSPLFWMFLGALAGRAPGRFRGHGVAPEPASQAVCGWSASAGVLAAAATAVAAAALVLLAIHWTTALRADLYYQLGERARIARSWDVAISDFAMAARLEPRDEHLLALGRAYFGRAIGRRSAENLRPAIRSLERARSANPYHLDSYLSLGDAYLYWGRNFEPARLTSAVLWYRRLLARDRFSAEGHRYLGEALAARGDLGGAVAEWREVVRLKPDYRAVYLSLADAYTKLHRPKEAARMRALAAALPE